jgi:hypothetical protein
MTSHRIYCFPEAEARKVRIAAEKEKKSKAQEERKKRERKAIRQAELETYYERERIGM